MRWTSLLFFAALGLALILLLQPAAHSDAPAAAAKQAAKVVLVIHGGAGVLSDKEMAEDKLTTEQFENALAEALTRGYQALQRDGATSVDGVEAAIRFMEDCDLFNAGKGAVLDNDGRASLDASIMQGKMTTDKNDKLVKLPGKRDSRKRAGAVAGVAHIKNPISAARAVMEMPDQKVVMLIGEGAEWFALGERNRDRYHLEQVSNVYFWTNRRIKQIQKAVEGERKRKAGKAAGQAPVEHKGDGRFGTVGAVALKNNTLTAGTSTGGLTNKLRGRVGDSPIIGAGTYADDRACGVSCTGTGEVFIRHAVAHDVVARMLYKEVSVDKAVQQTIKQLPDEEEGVGGLIALDSKGNHSFGISPECPGMYRGYVTDKGEIFVGTAKDKMKPMKSAPRSGK